MFHANEVFDVMIEINVMFVENWLHDSKFDHIKYVTIGARIMIIENINTSKGALNGAFVIVTFIIFNNDKIITNIAIKIITTNIQIMFKKQTLQHKYTSKTCYYKASFFIVLAYATSGHKAQGATSKSKVIIDIKNSFALGLTYMMLSRVTNHSNLLICQILIPTMF
jgi:ATP-dependent exoDNAse (exonuclease V) alpha subunit